VDDRVVSISEFIDGDHLESPSIGNLATLRGTATLVDGIDDWTQSFLEYLNITQPPYEFARGDRIGQRATQFEMSALDGALSVLASSWPAMRDELVEHVRLVTPFSSQQGGAFTNTAWQCGIFLRVDPRDPAGLLERLVHEASHARLNVAMADIRLHEHGWDDTVPSPFRAGPRPVTGLYQGAVVFARAAAALDRAYQWNGDPSYPVRIPRLVNQVREALATLRSVRLTELGQGLLDDTAEQVDQLADTYGVSSDESEGDDD
jgi:HEXXH motif-containing protein